MASLSFKADKIKEILESHQCSITRFAELVDHELLKEIKFSKSLVKTTRLLMFMPIYQVRIIPPLPKIAAILAALRVLTKEPT
ncbi:MAG: hypothetical protein R2865_02875 [Deinococcales bacterium]